MLVRARLVPCLGALLFVAAVASPQATSPSNKPPRPMRPKVTPSPRAQTAPPPGLFRLGPVFVDPTFHISSLGLDTNVFYTPTNRHLDFTTSGGPGVDFILPMGAEKVTVGGDLDYIYFLRTPAQRKLAGEGRAEFDFGRDLFHGTLMQEFQRVFDRPGFEIDRRLVQNRWSSTATFGLGFFSRLPIGVTASREDNRVAPGEEFAGADLHRSLTRLSYRVAVVPQYQLTAKTSLLAGVDYEKTLFPLDEFRDLDSNRLYGGLLVSSEFKLGARIAAGVKLTRYHNGSNYMAVGPYADVGISYRFGPNTEVFASYGHDTLPDPLAVQVGGGARTTSTVDVYSVGVDRTFLHRFNIEVIASYRYYRSDAPVLLDTSEGALFVVRTDRIRQGSIDVGYLFGRLRVGLGAIYTDRRSRVNDFGVNGLILGATVRFTPN